jgi:cysteine desulfurase / selenocysteine lyase
MVTGTSERVGEPPTLDHSAAPWVAVGEYKLRDDARRFEQWECNYAGMCALGRAIDYAMAIGMARIERRVKMLASRLRSLLSALPRVTVCDLGGSASSSQCGIVTFTVADVDPEDVKNYLLSQQCYCSVSRPSSTLLDATRRSLPALIRSSVHYFNTEAELVNFGELVGEYSRSR